MSITSSRVSRMSAANSFLFLSALTHRAYRKLSPTILTSSGKWYPYLNKLNCLINNQLSN